MSTPQSCNQSTTCSTTTGSTKLTLITGGTLSSLLANIAEGDLFRLEVPDVWGEDEVVACMKDGTGFIPLSETRGTVDITPVLLASATTTPVVGNIDLGNFGVVPRTGSVQFRISIEPTSATGTISLNDEIVWAESSASSAEVIAVVDLETLTIPLSVNLTAGSADISFKGDIV